MTEASGDEQWPSCQRRTSLRCDEEVDPRRWSLGYRFCIDCGDGQKPFCSVPMHKSGYVVVTNKQDLKFVTVQTPREGGTS
jgi:hypothetical protein